jgi:undecaprenyl-diphosphatase
VQTLALLPGISRSGTTIAAGRFRNLQRADAARFSFLLSAPLIFGAGILQLFEVISRGMVLAEFALLTAGFLSALVSSYFVIRWLLNFLRSRSTVIFAYYCIGFSMLNIIVYLLRS